MSWSQFSNSGSFSVEHQASAVAEDPADVADVRAVLERRPRSGIGTRGRAVSPYGAGQPRGRVDGESGQVGARDPRGVVAALGARCSITHVQSLSSGTGATGSLISRC